MSFGMYGLLHSHCYPDSWNLRHGYTLHKGGWKLRTQLLGWFPALLVRFPPTGDDDGSTATAAPGAESIATTSKAGATTPRLSKPISPR